MGNYIRFDWAMKRLLRQKANYVILEGLLSVLLGEKIRIRHILESEGNKETEDDKFNRVDLLAENTRGQLMIVEIQNNRELDYFHRMLYGTKSSRNTFAKARTTNRCARYTASTSSTSTWARATTISTTGVHISSASTPTTN